MSPLPPLHLELLAIAELRELLRSPVFADPPAAGLEGQPVMLIPGFMASDRSLAPLAGWLRRAGYAPCRAGIRVNTDCSEREAGRLAERLERAVDRRGAPALIVGHSRGGLFARVLAVRRPDLVAGIVTLGSPLVDPGLHVHPLIGMHAAMVGLLGDLRVPGMFSNDCGDESMFRPGQMTPFVRVLSWRARRRIESRAGPGCCSAFWQDLHGDFPPSVHFASLYSRRDGVVDRRAMLDPAARMVEVRASHFGMASSASTFRVLARELPAMAVRPEPARGSSAPPSSALG